MTVLVSDSFNRNSTTTLGITDSYNGGTAKTWTTVKGVLGTNGLQAYPVSMNGSSEYMAVLDSGISNGKATVTFVATNTFEEDLYFRYQDASNYFVVTRWGVDSYISKVINGTQTNITKFTSWTAGTTVRVEFNGSSISVYYNNTLKASITDASLSTATKVGIGGYGQTTASYDNFIVEDFNTGTPTGTDGSTTFDLKQQFYSSSLFNADVKQLLYQDASLASDSKQSIYSDSSLNVDTKLSLYSDSLTNADTKQVLYQDGSLAVDSKQILYNTYTNSYDMLQTLIDQTILSISFDMKIVIWKEPVIFYKLYPLSVDIDVNVSLDMETEEDFNISSYVTYETALEFEV